MHSIFRIIRNTCKNASRNNFKIMASNISNVSNKDLGEKSDSDAEHELFEHDEEYETLANRCLGRSAYHNCLIVHPYIKWGPKQVKDTNPERQLEEAEALIRTLSPWKIHETIAVPLLTLHKKTLFGTGTLEKLKKLVREDPRITALFINVGRLKYSQVAELEQQFKVTILDRYKIVIQILRLHAISSHAKLQVALAELPYIRSQLRKEDFSIVASEDWETRKFMLQNREQKIKAAINKLKSQRELLRKRRRQKDFPVVAVVGYTNAGKTSLIKALTGDSKLQPKNQLFATLDVTVHAALLPSTLEVLYVDTVGFISDIPTTLIECFVVTLEDALLADVIVHVEDLSSNDLVHQRRHVLSTLENLTNKTGCQELLKKMITVGNKCDLVQSDITTDENVITVSSTTLQGIDNLRYKIEKAILDATGRRTITIKVPSGGDEMRWLYKNSTIVSVAEDPNNMQLQNMKVIITQPKLDQFKHYFIKGK